MGHFYPEHTLALRQALADEVPTEELRVLHKRNVWRHFAITAGLVLALVGSTVAIVALDRWYLWLPLAFISGFAIFNFTVLLHEVVHRTVLDSQSERINRLVGILYAVPSGISSTQFSRWHLDHHANLGSSEDDPKRHHLSPKINARWLKILYFTPALFVIYSRAAKKESATYPPEMQRTIKLERNLTILFHLSVLTLVGLSAGWMIAWKAYLVPYFFVFPIAFALNRLGQHYDIDPADPAKWSTLVRGSAFWDIVFLSSNYHLEHHYFPGVPFYNLPRLQKLLIPFYQRRGFVSKTYGGLLWNYIGLNKKPHTNWTEPRNAPAVPANAESR